MTSETVEQFRRALGERLGWRLETDPARIESLLAARLRPGQPADEYLRALSGLPASAPEWRQLAEELAVSETYFFRNAEQFAALREVALPDCIARRPSGPLRCLSAGAASGEEAYSIAIVVQEERAKGFVPPVEILGIDVSRRAVEKARKARYSRWALRTLPPGMLERFFEPLDGQFALRPDIAGMVRFDEKNLLSLDAGGEPWSIVFFRNTCMYFTTDAARQIMAHLSRQIAPGGYLFLGHAENLRGLSDDFELQHTHETFYYTRREGASRPLPPASWGTAAPLPVQRGALPVLGDNDAWFHEIARASERVAALVDRADPPPDAAAAATRPPPGAAPLASTLALLAEERYDEALKTIGDAADPDRLIVRAVLLTHLGRFDEARAACSRILSLDSMHAGAHYLLALCEEAAGRDEGAITHDEMAIHLDPTFAMPHVHLGLMARRRGQRAAGAAHVRAARELLIREDSARIVLFGGGFGRRALLQLCDAQLARLAR